MQGFLLKEVFSAIFLFKEIPSHSRNIIMRAFAAWEELSYLLAFLALRKETLRNLIGRPKTGNHSRTFLSPPCARRSSLS